jgi:2-polyprenyl-3-methyl-5-hydroxy-6-metoxy-1,4-benzoquinol methylase
MIKNFNKFLEGKYYQHTAQEYGDTFIGLKAKRGIRPNKEGYFEELPSPELSEDLLIEYYQPGFKLLDIGCGIGNILRMGRSIGYDTTGVEINKKLEKHHEGLNVIYGDILSMPNYNFLKEFDVIYLYRPIEPLNKCDKLFEILHKYCKPTVIIIYLLPSQLNLNLQRKFEYELFPILNTKYSGIPDPNFPYGKVVEFDSGKKTKYQYDRKSGQFYSVLSPKPGINDINIGQIIKQIIDTLKSYEIKVGKTSFYAGKPSFKFKKEDYIDFRIKFEKVINLLKKYNLINITFEYESNDIRGPVEHLSKNVTTQKNYTKRKRGANYNNVLQSIDEDMQDERVKYMKIRLLYNFIDGQYYEYWSPFGSGYF